MDLDGALIQEAAEVDLEENTACCNAPPRSLAAVSASPSSSTSFDEVLSRLRMLLREENWSQEILHRARILAHEAIKLDPENAEAAATLVTIRHWLRPSGESEKPNTPRCSQVEPPAWVLDRSSKQFPQGRKEEGISRERLTVFEAVSEGKELVIVAFVTKPWTGDIEDMR